MRNVRLLSLMVVAVMSQLAAAAEDSDKLVDLGALHATIDTDLDFISLQDNEYNLASDTADWLRYQNDVSEAKTGRFGGQGFSMRGVDGNRVAIIVDGVSLPNIETHSPVFSGYGYMYDGRITLDPELASGVALAAGGKAALLGNGAIGGAVSYQTKDPRHLLGNKNFGGYVKTGYKNRNGEKQLAAGVAGKTEATEFLLNYTQKFSNEYKNYAMAAHNPDKLIIRYKQDPLKKSNPNALILQWDYPEHTLGAASPLPDPAKRSSRALLAKAYFYPSSEHRLGVQALYQDNKSQAVQISRADSVRLKRRLNNDQATLTKYGLNYRYTPSTGVIAKLDAGLDYQHAHAIANAHGYQVSFETDKPSFFNEFHIRPSIETAKRAHVDIGFAPIETTGRQHRLSLSASAGTRTSQNDTLDEWDCDLKTEEAKIKAKRCLGEGPHRNYKSVDMPSVKAQLANISINDDISAGRWQAGFGARYDFYRYQPFFTDAQMADLANPKTPTNAYALLLPEQPNDKEELKERRRKFKQQFAQYENFKAGSISFLGKVGYQFAPNWQVQARLSNGFLMPTISQLYGFYEGWVQEIPGFISGLQPEHSLNKELLLQGRADNWQVDAGLYHTKYRNFIGYNLDNNAPGPINIPDASSYGVNLKANYALSKANGTQGGWSLVGAISADKSQAGDNGASLPATQPMHGVLGIDYLSAAKDWDAHARVNWALAKNPRDALYTTSGGILITDDTVVNSSKPYAVLDLFANKRFGGLTLSAGLYNVLNKKYYTWDGLRATLKARQAGNDQLRDDGLERYTEPGRNFALSASYRF